jgi:hypothetical protein
MLSVFVLINCRYPFEASIADLIFLKSPFVSNIYRTEGRYEPLIKLNATQGT